METTPDLSHFVKALSSAFALTAKALQTEVAVAFVVFHKFGSTSAAAKKALRQVYADAGRRDCLTPDSPAYQTVMRRIGRCAALLEALGWRRLNKLLKVDSLTDAGAVALVIDFIAPLQLESMDDVAAHAGRPRRADAGLVDAAPKHRRAADAPEVVHVKTRHIDVAIPPDATAKELTALANKLLVLAGKMEG